MSGLTFIMMLTYETELYSTPYVLKIGVISENNLVKDKCLYVSNMRVNW